MEGKVLCDPQFYLPRADHHRLTSHSYWPQDYDTAGFGSGGRQVMMEELARLNRKLGTDRFIVPGERAEEVDDIWIASQRELVEAARQVADCPLIATICLSEEAIGQVEQISRVVMEAEILDVSAYYLVLERPGYLVAGEPTWLANTLDLAVGLRKLGADVIVGYSNHQQLVMACAGVSAIAAGTHRNVRLFSTDKFSSPAEGEIRRPNTWYYCPQALSEYTLAFLDIGVRQGLTSELRPDPWTKYADPLFAVPQPTASGWNRTDAFRHYLAALRIQVLRSAGDSFDETVASHRALLRRAEELVEVFRSKGVLSRYRDFLESVDDNRAALHVLEATHGPILRRRWAELV
ncbi:MAG: hypothetical protein GF383_16845 [Candidatus Lokiarchaeota archaeon]|nr:hypothetical protein [Candidatus Lokiarchaeota archaeon]